MVRRRTLLRAGFAAAAVGLAGCSGGTGGDGDETDTTGGDATTAPPSTTTAGPATTTADEFGTAPPIGETTVDAPVETPAPRTTERRESGFASGFGITSAYGTAIEDRTVGVVRVRLAVESGVRIDTSTIRVRWIDPSGTYTLVDSEYDGRTEAYFGRHTITDDNESAPVLDDPSDEIELVFDLGDSDTAVDDPFRAADHPGRTSFGNRLRGGSVISAQFASGSGRSLTRRLEVPSNLRGERRVELRVS